MGRIEIFPGPGLAREPSGERLESIHVDPDEARPPRHLATPIADDREDVPGLPNRFA
jgi:hypothetical protein